MAFDGGKKKKITVIGMAVILVVGAVVGSIVTVRRNNKKVEINTQKAGGKKTAVIATTAVVILICKYTDFRRICEETLQRLGVGKVPKELMTVSFNVAVENIQGVIENSYTVRQAAKDPMAAKAVDLCKELLDCSIEDLKRAVDRWRFFDRMSENVVNLRVWLSGAVTYQETCLDAFENTTGDSGVRMRKMLEFSNMLTRNSLAMLDGVSFILENSPLRSDPRRVNPNFNQPNNPDQPLPNKPGIFGLIPGPKTPPGQDTTIINRKQGTIINEQQQQQQGTIINGQQGKTTIINGQSVPSDPNGKLGLDWKADITVHHTYVKRDGTVVTKGGNRRMLDDQSGDSTNQFSSKLQVGGDEAKPTDEDSKSYPSWADSVRRSLIDVDPKTLKPNAVVAQDGSGNFKTIMEAVNTAPQKKPEPFVILIKEGTYKENVIVPRHVENVVFLGEGPEKTKITGSKNFVDGVGTYQTATVAVNGDGFIGKDLFIENTAGPEKHQAVALRVSADLAIFHNCVMDAFQDTLYTHSYRQFYRQCTISGTIDFVFGDAAAVFQDCKLIVKKPMDNQACMVTAQGRKDRHSVGGLVLQGCTITAAPEFMNANPLPKSYLGRPWKEFSRTVIMQSFIDQNIAPEGWSPWTGNFGQNTCYYAEFNNNGPGANTAQRVKWMGVKKISPKDAERFTPGSYIQGDGWIPQAGVPYDSGMMKI